MDKIKEVKRANDDKIKAKYKQNFKEVSLLCNYLGDIYSSNGHFEKAVQEHKEELEMCRKLNDDLGIAVAYRKLGECYSELGEFQNALNFQHKYLALVEKLHNLVEIQRAWATLGRTYFMFYSSDPKINEDKLTTAKSAHLKALHLTDRLKNELKEKDYAEMRCRAFLNLGLIYDQKDDEQECSSYFKRAINLAKQYGFKEDLYRCEISLATFYAKTGIYTKALQMYNASLISAKKLKNLTNIYDVYIGKANTFLYIQDFENAKHCFKKAYFLFKNDCTESNEAKNYYNLAKQVILSFRELTNSQEIESKIKLCDNLGDIFVELNCYTLAIQYYKLELENSIACNVNKKKLAGIYLSLGQTYLDNKQYNEALFNFNKELECIKGDIDEEVRVNLKLIEIKILNSNCSEEIINEYEKLIKNNKLNNKLKKLIYQDYLNFLDELIEFRDLYKNLINEIKSKLENLNNLNDLSEDEDLYKESETKEETSFELKIEDVSDLTSDSETEENEEIAEQRSKARKLRNKLDNKRNEKGETLLHRACIEGNLEQVEKLIEKGHKINIRDNCGWLPIHEASNHGFVEIVEILLKHKAWINDPGGRDCDGTTPLHDACTNGHIDVIRVLIKGGANVACVDYHNNTPLDCLLEHLKRVKDLTLFEKKDFQMLIDEFKERMKECGYNEKKNLKRPFSLIETSHKLKINDLLESPPRKSSCLINNAGFSNKQDSKKCTDLRRNLDPAADSEFPKTSKFKTKINSLIDEEKIVDDWLEDDIGTNFLKKKKKTSDPFQNINNSENNYNFRCSNKKKNLNEIEIDMFDSDSKSSLNDDLNLIDENSVEEIDDDEDNVKCVSITKKATNKKRKQSKIKNYFNSNEVIINKTEKKIDEKLLSKDDNLSKDNLNNSNQIVVSQKLKVRAHIDDLMLLIPIPSSSTSISWLINETIERYYLFKKIKPKVILTTQDGALLSPEDKIVDVLNNMEVFVKIDAFDIKPLNEVYIDLCGKHQVEVLPELELEYQTSMTSGCLCLRNCNLSEQQFNLFVDSLKMQNKIKVLDFSFSNLIKQDINYELLQSISSLSNLEVINLECTGLNHIYLKELSKLNLDKLTYLNLNYNFLMNSSEYIYKLIKNCKNLYKLNIEFCDLTEDLILNLNLNQLIENRSIQIKIDPYLNSNFKSSKYIIDWSNMPQTNDLDYQEFKKKLFI